MSETWCTSWQSQLLEGRGRRLRGQERVEEEIRVRHASDSGHLSVLASYVMVLTLASLFYTGLGG